MFIKVGDEWASRSTTGNSLECRCFYLCVSCVVQYLANGAQYCCTLKECIFHAVVDNQVNIALTIAKFRIVELVVSHTILVFHYWKWLQALAQKCNLLCVDRNLACLCAEYVTLHTDKVTDVHQLLKYLFI